MLFICTHCHENKIIDEFPKDKYKTFGIRKKCKICTKSYLDQNHERRLSQKRLFNASNPDKVSEYKKKHFQSAKPHIMAKKRYRRANDPFYRLQENLRCRARNAFRKQKWVKGSPNEVLLGADYNTVINHIQSLFIEGMTWDKVGMLIHIDHVVPLSSARSEDELRKLFHYTNLQPLWAADNLRKGCRVDQNFSNLMGPS